ncbi:MAG: hypothetical protein R3Y07_00140 [Eubacteriales bacterium]
MITIQPSISDIPSKKSVVIIWGTSAQAIKLVRFFKEYHFEVHAFCNNDPEKWGETFIGFPIISPSELEDLTKESGFDVIIQLLGDEKSCSEIAAQVESFAISRILYPNDAWDFCETFVQEKQQLSKQNEETLEERLRALSHARDVDLCTQLEEGFYLPYQAQFSANFDKNKSLLVQYPYLFQKEMIAPSETEFSVFPVNEEKIYCYHKMNGNYILLETYSEHETKHFFENLDDPIFVSNEFNEFNLKFLVDNVRASELVAQDNHIYLQYDNMEEFSFLLYYVDFEPLLKDEKIVFLIGEEERNLCPINFKEKFNIDYDSMEVQEVQPPEIKRITVQLHLSPFSGNALMNEILDGHSAILSANGGFSKFGFYNFDEKNNILPFESFLNDMKRNIDAKNIPQLELICCHLKLPKHTHMEPSVETKLEAATVFWGHLVALNEEFPVSTLKDWIVSLYIAYVRTRELQLPSRIAPMIHHFEHDVRAAPYHYSQLRLMYDDFDYTYYYFPMRDLFPRKLSGVMFTDNDFRKLLDVVASTAELETNLKNCIGTWFAVMGPLLIEYNNVPLTPRTLQAIRFEDLKLNPKATLTAICRQFNIPYSDILQLCTKNHKGYEFYNPTLTEAAKTGFHIMPLYREGYDYLSLEERKFYESVFGSTITPYEYTREYTKENDPMISLEERYNQPFAFEQKLVERLAQYSSQDFTDEIEKNRRIMIDNLVKNSAMQSKYSVTLLRPVPELLVHELYQNQSSLPKLEDLDVTFLDAPLLSTKQEKRDCDE